MVISFEGKGDMERISRFLKKAAQGDLFSALSNVGQQGVSALQAATPARSGRTASSWSYKVTQTRDTFKIEWLNSNVNQGVNIAVLIQYGHGTGTGGYVQGVDYINPAMRPIFDKLLQDARKAVQNA